MSPLFNICEIYETLMGESSASGLPCTIIRTGGCNLNCTFCDTRYALTEYESLPLDEILIRVATFYPQRALVTGGEPLIQPHLPLLLTSLLERGYIVYLETNGSLEAGSLDKRVIKILDIKCPGSGESQKNHFKNLEYMTKQDEVKFVICNREDFEWAHWIVKKYKLQGQATVLFSPVSNKLEPALLAEWIIRERLEVRFQIQLHKFLWGERRGV